MLDEMSLGLAPVIVDRLLPVVREFATRGRCGLAGNGRQGSQCPGDWPPSM
jgi:hypothetical protein